MSDPSLDINRVDNTGDSALHLAVGQDVAELVEILLSREDIQINIKNLYGLTPLARAMVMNKKSLVCLLLQQKGIQVNFVDIRCYTPLHHAVLLRNLELVELLLENEKTNLSITNRPFNKDVVALSEEESTTEIRGLVQKNLEKHTLGDFLDPGDSYMEIVW